MAGLAACIALARCSHLDVRTGWTSVTAAGSNDVHSKALVVTVRGCCTGVMSVSQVVGCASAACSVLVVSFLGYAVENGIASTDCITESKLYIAAASDTTTLDAG